MSKALGRSLVLAVLGVLAFCGTALAAPGNQVSNGLTESRAVATAASRVREQVEAKGDGTCAAGKLVVSVSHRVVNDGDYRDPTAGWDQTYWARDTYVRTIRVWQRGDSFCALVGFDGSFTTIKGASPLGTDKDGIAAGIKGL